MTWNSTSEEQIRIAEGVVLWIETARAAGYGGDTWLPSGADFYKSALFERIRAGKKPLPEPPPLGLACPWYALVEDAGPHYVFDVWREDGIVSDYFPPDTIFALQHPYRIVENRGEKDFIVRDGRHETSYRFRLWFDAEWKHPNGRTGGGWFLQNTTFHP